MGGDRRREVLRCLARLIAQARLNSAGAAELGRSGEANAWSEVALFLETVAGEWRARGLAAQLPLF